MFALIVFYLFFNFIFITSFLFSFGESDNWDEKIDDYEKKQKEYYLNPVNFDIKMSEFKLEAWDSLKIWLNSLLDVSRALYDPTRSPFRKVKVFNSNADSFSVKTAPGVLPAKYYVKVKQLATYDKISSGYFTKDKRIEGGVFSIGSAGSFVKVDFSAGGTSTDLKNAIKLAGDGLFSVELVGVDQFHDIIVISSLKTGKKNKIVFNGNDNFLFRLGFLKKINNLDDKKKDKLIDKKDLDYNEAFFKFIKLKSKALKGNYYFGDFDNSFGDSEDIKINLLDNDRQSNFVGINFSSKVLFYFPIKKIDSSLYLEFEYNIRDDFNKKKDYKLIENVFDFVKVEDIRIDGQDFIRDLDDYNDAVSKFSLEIDNIKNDRGENNNFSFGEYIVFFGENDYRTEAIFFNNMQKKNIWYKYKVRVSDFVSKMNNINSLLISNDFDRSTLEIRNFRFISNDYKNKQNNKVNFSSDFEYNFIEKAQDANFLFNSVDMYRNSNEVKDVVKGVDLSLISTSDKSAKVEIVYNYDKMLELISKFVDQYNSVMLYINNLLTPVKQRYNWKLLKEKLDEFNSKTYDEKQYFTLSGEKYKGIINSEYTLRLLKNRLREIITGTPYDNSFDRKIKFLKQIGLRNPGQSGGKVDLQDIIAGYIELDKAILSAKLRTNMKEVRDLFSHASEGSLVKDKGISVSFVNLINPYIKRIVRDSNNASRPGVVELYKDRLEKKIKDKKRLLEDLEKKIKVNVFKFKTKIEKIKITQQQREHKMNSLRGLNPK